jgi:hypothetical protein
LLVVVVVVTVAVVQVDTALALGHLVVAHLPNHSFFLQLQQTTP